MLAAGASPPPPPPPPPPPAAPPPEIGNPDLIREWTDPAFTAITLNSFPDKSIADVEEARVGGFCRALSGRTGCGF